MNDPWATKRRIETAFRVAERYGFELREHCGQGNCPGEIFLYAAPDNDVFSKDTVLNVFETWEDVLMFFLGYEKADIACLMRKGKR